jgi:hypothetical protein
MRQSGAAKSTRTYMIGPDSRTFRNRPIGSPIGSTIRRTNRSRDAATLSSELNDAANQGFISIRTALTTYHKSSSVRYGAQDASADHPQRAS